MMENLKDILKSKVKPKEKTALLLSRVREDEKLLNEIVACFMSGSVAEKGTCMEVMEAISKDKPEWIFPFLAFAIDNLDEKAPRIQWESARVIANLASRYPDKAAKALPKLLAKTKEEGTVLRWSVALALSEIAKANPKLQKELVPKMNQIAQDEENNGVKKIYLKALKVLG